MAATTVKPRLRLLYDEDHDCSYWFCQGAHAFGVGSTATQAYEAWSKYPPRPYKAPRYYDAQPDDQCGCDVCRQCIAHGGKPPHKRPY